MEEIMSGKATPPQIGAFLTALKIKGETPAEIAAFARTMRDFATKIDPDVGEPLVDTCGTGGDELNSFNISTTAMFVAAGAGVKIAKHGNRSVTSRSGSADVLEEMGVDIDLSPGKAEEALEKVGLAFMFAPAYHGAMKHAIGPRKEIEIRTVFNILGPLTNPAGAKSQVLGVYDPSLTEKLARVLKKLDCRRAMVVHGMDGLDEISTLGKTKISKLDSGGIDSYTVKPEDFGISRARPGDISGGDPEKNARILLRIFEGEAGPERDIVVLNTAAAIFVGGKAGGLEEGIELAEESIDSGKAYEKLVSFVKETDGDIERFRELEDSI